MDSATVTIDVTNLTSGAAAPIKVTPLELGYGDATVAFEPDGWKPVAGETYRVVAQIPSLPAFIYEVKPIDCEK
jgi:hypothetical protein